jgi:hypothetical protein
MLYFLSSTIIELGLDVSWWLLKKGTYLVYNGVLYIKNYGEEIPPTEVGNISDSIVIIENEALLDELREIKSMLSNNREH